MAPTRKIWLLACLGSMGCSRLDKLLQALVVDVLRSPLRNLIAGEVMAELHLGKAGGNAEKQRVWRALARQVGWLLCLFISGVALAFGANAYV